MPDNPHAHLTITPAPPGPRHAAARPPAHWHAYWHRVLTRLGYAAIGFAVIVFTLALGAAVFGHRHSASTLATAGTLFMVTAAFCLVYVDRRARRYRAGRQ